MGSRVMRAQERAELDLRSQETGVPLYQLCGSVDHVSYIARLGVAVGLGLVPRMKARVQQKARATFSAQ